MLFSVTKGCPACGGQFDQPAHQLRRGKIDRLDQDFFAALQFATVVDEDFGQPGYAWVVHGFAMFVRDVCLICA